MTRNHLIVKSLSYLLIGVLIHMHVCSAWCNLLSEGGCGHNTAEEKTVKTCCSHQKDNNHKESGCQDFHLAFFKASGQFSSEKSIEVVNIIPVITAILFEPVKIQSIDVYQNIIAYNSLHPPRPIVDIRIFIQSFQI